MSVQRYVAGFYFANGDRQVALVKKTHPAWQAGKWNGIGGHVEPGEAFHQAMVREFEEETGVVTSESDWRYVVNLIGDGWMVGFFAMRGAEFRGLVNEDNGEWISFVCVDQIQYLNTIPNLRWIVPLCLDESLVTPIIIDEKRPQ